MHPLFSAQDLLSKIDPIQRHKTSFNNFKWIEIISSILSNHKRIKLEINNRKKSVVRGKIVTLCAYSGKEERFKINDLSFHLKMLEKQSTKSNANKRKVKIIKSEWKSMKEKRENH